MSPFQILNRFSFIFLPLALLALLVGLLIWRRAGWPWWIGLGGLLVVYLAFLLSAGQSTTARYDTPEAIRQSLATAQQPTLIEFFSNY